MFNISEGQSLFIALSLLYLSDCFIWVGMGSVVYIGSVFGKWAPRFGSSYLGTDTGGIVQLNLLPPAGRVFCAHLIPFSISPSAVVSNNPQTIKVAKPINAPIQEYLIEQIQDIKRNEREVLINGKTFCKFGHTVQADKAVLLIEGLKGEHIEKREDLITKFWETQFDLDQAKRVRSQLADRTIWLTRFSNLLFVLLLASPLINVPLGLNLTIVIVACLMYLLAIVIASIFYRSHSELFIDQKSDRLLEMIKMIICPPIAIRAADQLSTNLFAKFDFFLVAYLTLSPEKFRSFAAEAFRCLKYPEVDTSLTRLALETIEWQNRCLLAIAEKFLNEIKYDSKQFLLPPAPQDVGSVSYCPRCMNESYSSNGECIDCFGVKMFSL